MVSRRHVTRVGKRNQVTIPAGLLRELGVGPGDPVVVAASGAGEIKLQALKAAIAAAIGVLHRPGMTPLTDEELENVIRQAGDEHAELAAQDDERIRRQSTGA